VYENSNVFKIVKKNYPEMRQDARNQTPSFVCLSEFKFHVISEVIRVGVFPGTPSSPNVIAKVVNSRDKQEHESRTENEERIHVPVTRVLGTKILKLPRPRYTLSDPYPKHVK
jgi:hypothetical protein